MTISFEQLPPTFTYGEALAAGLTKRQIYRLRDRGFIERVAHGLYQRVDLEELVDLGLVEIARRAPRATLCLTTALVRHNLTDANPPSVDVALPTNSHRPRITTPVTWHMFDPATFEVGRETMVVDQHTRIGIYSAERCIVDAFRLRHREGEDLAYIALRRWLRRRGSSPAALYEVARHFPRTVKPITAALEILLYE